ncbi:DUF2000 family protein [Sodalis sp. RH24]|uniref:DUF2000 family protein n=2 Tax=Sodalis TaxID=84565 RepID=UPI003965B76D
MNDDMVPLTKTAIILLDPLPLWKKLNVTAFLATGIGDASPEAMSEIYIDADERQYTRLFGQPIVVFSASQDTLLRALRVGQERGLTCSAYVSAMFDQSHGEEGRRVFRAEHAHRPDLVGLAVRGPRKDVDKAIKGARLHP